MRYFWLSIPLMALAPVTLGQNVKEIWKNNCTSCHGDNAQGGSADSMLDDDWVTDGSNRALYDAVMNGIEAEGMPGYKGGLSEAEAWATVVYLHEMRYSAKEGEIPRADRDGEYDSQHHRYKVETIAKDIDGMDRPWAIDFLPPTADNASPRMIVTERSGNMYVIEELGQGEARRITNVPKVRELGQGGLLDVAVHPDYANPDKPGHGWIYLTYSIAKDDDNGKANTVLARGKLDGNKWIDHEVIYQPPMDKFPGSGVHFGSRIVFDGDGHIFFVIGERGQQAPAQKLDFSYGKVHRVNEDGSVPRDNPFADSATPTTWTKGHRNPQGLSMHPETGKLYTVEHGPRGGDELNLIESGNDYGWPTVAYSMNYNMKPFGEHAPFHEPMGFVDPVHVWLPSIAVCGSSFYTGDPFTNWKNDLFVSALAKQAVYRLRLSEDGKSVVEEEILLKGMGRVRDVVTGPDGAIYVALEKPGRIVKLTPTEE